MKLRSVLFWLHLACGVVAGAVILMMCVTGVLLTYQRQITAWADMRGYDVDPPSGASALPADDILSRASAARPDLVPTAVTLRSDGRLPASVAFGPSAQVFVNPYTGDVLGEGNGRQVRDAFRTIVEWHRYVGRVGDSRPLGRAITGASNLMFLFIVLSGLVLWWPRTWTWAAIRNVLWFRGGLRGKPRDFNWHNTIGFWSAVPLAIIVAGGVVISYPWATALVYRAYGEAPPVPGGSQAARPGRAEVAGLEAMVTTAEARNPEWKTISIAMPASSSRTVTVTVDGGDGGQPHKRAALLLDRATGEVTRWEPYSALSSGRQARTWLRFAHTGEVYGLPGQTVAGLVTAGGAVLVWTGLALALRRFFAWRKRGRAALANAA